VSCNELCFWIVDFLGLAAQSGFSDFLLLAEIKIEKMSVFYAFLFCFWVVGKEK
jgi:hypothetical protein